MSLELETGKCKVWESGTVMAFDFDSSITLNAKFDDTFSFSITIEFKEDDGKPQIESKVADNKITFFCTNFTNTIGTGLYKAIRVASFNDKNIYFSFWVYGLGSATNAKQNRKVDYCFYIEK